MNLYKKKYLYTNGSSITAGGGFEEIKYRVEEIRDLYKNMGVELPETQVECSYPYFLAKNLKLELINDAKCGSGIDRMIRTTTQWIVDNPEKLDQTIIILEPQVGIRLDWYVSEWDDYGIVNAHRNEKGEYPLTLVKDWFRDDEEEQVKWNQRYDTVLSEYFLNFFNPHEHHNQETIRLIGLLGYLNYKKIDYLITIPPYARQDHQNELNKIIPISSNLENIFNGGLWSYASDNKLLICDEIDNSDNHIGYFGNQHVADKIYEFIKFNKTINYYSFGNSIVNTSSMTSYLANNSSINFKRVHNIDDGDFVYIADMEIFNFPYTDDSAFKELIAEKFPKLDEVSLKDKRILLSLVHERVFQNQFVEFIYYLESEYGIKKSQIWFIDLSYAEYPLTNYVPLELKIRQFSNIGNYTEYNDKDHFRTKKIICLNNKVIESRLMVFDRLLHAYENHEIMKEENFISMRELHVDINSLDSGRFKNSISKYQTLEFPWTLDSWDRKNQPAAHEQLPTQIDFFKDSIIAVVSETERINLINFRPQEDFHLINNMQFSEKCLIPIIGGTFTFVITDGSFYRAFENIGFDFSYLKKLFNISYTTNTLRDNIEDVGKIVNFVKNKSIGELNIFREKHYHYIEHNRNLLLDLLYGDYNEICVKFWENLSGKQLL